MKKLLIGVVAILIGLGLYLVYQGGYFIKTTEVTINSSVEEAQDEISSMAEKSTEENFDADLNDSLPRKSLERNSSVDLDSTEANKSDPDMDVALQRKIDQLFIIGFRGYTYNSSRELKKAIETTNLGGVILFDYDQGTKKYARNIESSAQLKTLISDIKSKAEQNGLSPLFVSLDEEGGKVSRLKRLSDFVATPSAATLGTKPLSEVKDTAYKLGQELKNFGFNLDFAPVLDVNINPANPVIGKVERSFSSDPQIVSEKGLAFFEGLKSAGILSAVKHFPGHGSSTSDSHLGFVDISATYKDYELDPFKAACKAGAPIVMVGHLFNKNIDPTYPTTLSKAHIDILKNVAGCKSQLIISDDMDMGAITSHYSRKEALTRTLNADC